VAMEEEAKARERKVGRAAMVDSTVGQAGSLAAKAVVVMGVSREEAETEDAPAVEGKAAVDLAEVRAVLTEHSLTIFEH